MWAIFLLTGVVHIIVAAENACEQRCRRIHTRTLARVGFNDDKLHRLLDKQWPLGTTKDICWRVYDHLDCMKKCNTSPEHANFARYIRSKCHVALKGMEGPLSCVSRQHSSIEERCSTFLEEAEQLKSRADPTLTPTQKICRYLHMNTLCLENSVTTYCPKAKKFFRRVNFRDYFPNFILPANDTLFDDLDLDACQMFEHVKRTRKLTASQLDEELTSVINFLEGRAVATQATPSKTTLSTAAKEKREFTSLLEELLEEPETMPTSTAATTTSTTTSTPTTEAPSERSTSTETNKISLRTAAVKRSKLSLLTTLTTPSTTAEVSVSSTHSEVDYHYEEDETEAKQEHKTFTIDIVPIQLMNGHSKVPNEPEPPSTPKTRVFSDDSWEFTPPNFRYSSMRFGNGGVTPLNIDTTTLFGMSDDSSAEDEGEDDRTISLGKDEGEPKEIKPMSQGIKESGGGEALSAVRDPLDKDPFKKLPESKSNVKNARIDIVFPMKHSTVFKQPPTTPVMETTSSIHQTRGILDRILADGRASEEVLEEKTTAGYADSAQTDHKTTPPIHDRSQEDRVIDVKELRIGTVREEEAVRPSGLPSLTMPTQPSKKVTSFRRIGRPAATWPTTADSSFEATTVTHRSIEPTSSPPMLSGEHVVIKKIYSRNDVPSSEFAADDVEEVKNDEYSDEIEVPLNAHNTEESTTPPNITVFSGGTVKATSDRDTLILIYSLLFAVSIFTLMIILICCVWCRKTPQMSPSKPYYLDERW